MSRPVEVSFPEHRLWNAADQVGSQGDCSIEQHGSPTFGLLAMVQALLGVEAAASGSALRLLLFRVL